MSFCLITMCSTLWAIDEAPWLTPIYEFEPQVRGSYYFYPSVNCAGVDQSDSSHNQFYTLNLALTAFENWNCEIEFQAFDTKTHSFNFEYGRLALRTALLDDISGRAPISLAAGVIATVPVKEALFDLSCLHHWYFDGEIFLSLGKECSCGPTWDKRAYLVTAFGCASHGSPWIRGFAKLEKNICDTHHLRVFVEYIQGLGNNVLLTPEPFPGYARLAHHSLDAGLGYSYILFPWGTLSLDYSHRFYAQNFPDNAHRATLSLLIPFSL